MGKLDGRTCLVTGGASGIGRATAMRLVDEGALATVADVNAGLIDEVSDGDAISGVVADVSTSEGVRKAFDAAEEANGPVHIAHFNAGITLDQSDLNSVSDEDYRRITAINIDGVFFGVREAIERMPEGGSIVVTASIAGINSYPVDPVYALTKHAVMGLVRALAPSLEPRLSIDAICPGVVDTPLIGDARELFVESGFPLLSPEDVAEAVMFALTEPGTGRAIVVQPGREPIVYRFRGVPGPRGTGEGELPPIFQ